MNLCVSVLCSERGEASSSHRGMPRRHKVRITIRDKPPASSPGWWMVMAEDEQGYAPAAHLEPLEGSHYDHLTAEDASVDSSPGRWGRGGGDVRPGNGDWSGEEGVKLSFVLGIFFFFFLMV